MVELLSDSRWVVGVGIKTEGGDMKRILFVLSLVLMCCMLSGYTFGQAVIMKNSPEARMLISFYMEDGRYRVLLSFAGDDREITQLKEGDDVEMLDMYTGDIATLRVEEVLSRDEGLLEPGEQYLGVYRINTVDRYFINYFASMIVDKVDFMKAGISFYTILTDDVYKDGIRDFHKRLSALGARKPKGDFSTFQVLTVPRRATDWLRADRLDSKAGVVTREVSQGK